MLTHAPVSDNALYKVDAVAPTVASVSLTGATGAINNTLNAGDIVTASVTMSEAVTVTGTPTLKLMIGTTEVIAAYDSANSTGTLLKFNYTILPNQTDVDGISVNANSLSGGTVKDIAGNDAVLTHAAVGNNNSYMVDTTAPTATFTVPITATLVTQGQQNLGLYEYSGKLSATLQSGETLQYRSPGSQSVWYDLILENNGRSIKHYDASPTLEFRLTDAAGNVTTTTTVKAPPVAFDLNQDGIEYLSQSAGVQYDYNNDGILESTAWVAPDDGLLAERQSDGTYKIVFSTQDGETDLQGLAKTYDNDKDGQLDSDDQQFANFGVWQDADSDGVVDDGEFLSLTDRGIASLNLVSDGQSFMLADGDVIVYGTTSYTNIDGSTGIAQDVGFATTSGTPLPSEATWTNVIDITASDDPSVSASGSGAVASNSAEVAAGGWTVVVNSGSATFDADNNQILFSTDHALNSATITTADGTSQLVTDIDKIQWHG